MMWDVVAEEWRALLVENDALIAVLGGDRIYPAQSVRPIQVPSVEWAMVTDVEEELFNPVTFQVDFWAVIGQQAITIERLLRNLTHRDTARTLGGFRMWTRYIDSRSIGYPADKNVLHRSLDFEFRPARSKYANP